MCAMPLDPGNIDRPHGMLERWRLGEHDKKLVIAVIIVAVVISASSLLAALVFQLQMDDRTGVLGINIWNSLDRSVSFRVYADGDLVGEDFVPAGSRYTGEYIVKWSRGEETTLVELEYLEDAKSVTVIMREGAAVTAMFTID